MLKKNSVSDEKKELRSEEDELFYPEHKSPGCKEQKAKLANLISSSLDGLYHIDRKDKEPVSERNKETKKEMQEQMRKKQQKIYCHTQRMVWIILGPSNAPCPSPSYH